MASSPVLPIRPEFIPKKKKIHENTNLNVITNVKEINPITLIIKYFRIFSE